MAPTSLLSMSTTIHPTAIIDPGAEIGSGTSIGPYTIIGPNVTIGENCQIGPHVHIQRNTRLGKNNKIDSFVSLAGEPQDLGYAGEESWVEIGDENTLREYTHINRSAKEGGVTKIGNHCYFMGGVHVGHDSLVEDHVILVSNVALGGYSQIGHHAFISAFCGVHQFTRIGAFCMVGPLSKPSQDIPPFTLSIGAADIRVIGLNTVGLKRGGFTPAERKKIKEVFQIFYRSGLKRNEALDKIRTLEQDRITEEWLKFVEASTRGIIPFGKHSGG